MTTDLCPTTSPHGPHRRDLGPFGVKDCPGVADHPQTDQPGRDPGTNLTAQTLTDEDRAALYPTPPYTEADVEQIGRVFAAARQDTAFQHTGSHWEGPQGVHLDDARLALDALTTAGWRPARPGDTPGELAPEHGPTQPVDLTADAPTTSRPLPTLDEYLASARRLSPDTLRQHLADMYAVRDRQATQLDDAAQVIQAARDAVATLEHALALHDTTPTAEPDDQDRPECTALCRDVEADRDALQAAIDRADSVLIDSRDRIWRPAPDGCWQRPLYGHWTLAAITQQHGPTRAAWLIHLDDDQDDDRDPTVAERLATTAHAAADVADQLEQMEAERDDYARRLKATDRSWTEIAAERDQLRDTNDALALTLAEILGTITDHGTPGVRSTWIRHSSVARWKHVLHDAEQARAQGRHDWYPDHDGRCVTCHLPNGECGSSAPARAQDQVQSAARQLLQHLRATEPLRPADWERRAVDVVTDAWTHVEDDAAITAQRLAEIAVRALTAAGLAPATDPATTEG